MRVPRLPERDVQRQIVDLLARLGGCEVWVIGTTRRRGDYQGTMQTPGLPDLIAFVRGRQVYIEVKAKGGRLRPDQVRFREAALAAGQAHVVGGLDDVVRWLEAQGIRTGRQWAIEGEAPERAQEARS